MTNYQMTAKVLSASTGPSALVNDWLKWSGPIPSVSTKIIIHAEKKD